MVVLFWVGLCWVVKMCGGCCCVGYVGCFVLVFVAVVFCLGFCFCFGLLFWGVLFSLWCFVFSGCLWDGCFVFLVLIVMFCGRWIAYLMWFGWGFDLL